MACVSVGSFGRDVIAALPIKQKNIFLWYLTGAFEYISLSFQNILNCCAPFDSNNSVSAMILESNHTDVSSILVNSPSSKGL